MEKGTQILVTEIENHILDQREAYIKNGDEEVIATDKAILQMGDAVFVGQELDKTHKPKAQPAMIAAVAVLMLIGLFANYFISMSIGEMYNFKIVEYIIAFCIFIVCYFIDFTVLAKYTNIIYYGTIIISALAIMVATPLYGRLWIISPLFTISLAYLSTIFPVVFAVIVYSQKGRGYAGIINSGIKFIPLAVILLLVPTITGFLIFAISSLIVLCYSITIGWYGTTKKGGLNLVLIPTVLISAALIAFYGFGTSGFHRLNYFINPESEKMGKGWLYYQLREILSRSKLVGESNYMAGNIIGEDATAHIRWLSQEFKLTYLIDKLGGVVLILLIIAISAFAIFAVYKTIKQKNALGKYVGLAIISTFVLQSVFYIIHNLGYGLVSGYSLPLIISGTTAMFIDTALIGFMLSIFRIGDYCVGDNNISRISDENTVLVFQNGKLTIDFNKFSFQKSNQNN